MTTNHQSFEIGVLNERFNHISNEAVQVLAQQGGVYSEHAEQIRTQLKELQERTLLKMTFIGQYSSGKSSIISALTGNRHIKIDADIATDRATEYQWNGIVLTDTPGLFTERKDHDEVTYEAIKSSDLLVFVITSDLFDDIILDNFIKLAYRDGLRHKMKLVVNKMSMEPGDNEDLKENYTDSLRLALLPYQLSDFDISFIDAADYLEGVRNNKPKYVVMSHFGEFIAQLNEFSSKKGLLGKLDTPFRVVLAELDKAMLEAGAGQEDKTFFMILDRIEDRIRKSVRQSETQVQWVTSEIRSKVIGLGSALAAKVGQSDMDMEGESDRINAEIRRLTEEGSERLGQLLEEERSRLIQEIREIFEGDLGDAYLQSIEHAGDIQVSNVPLNDMSDIQKNFKSMSSLVENISGGILKLSVGTGAQKVGFLLNASGVAGSNMHKGIYAVGKFFGHNFKPWGAVNLATKIGNVVKVLGPILSIAAVVLDVVQMSKENREFQRIMAAKQDCMNSFIEMAESIESELRKQFDVYKKEAFLNVMDEITSRREEAVHMQQVSTAYEQRLLTLRGDLQQLLSEVHSPKPSMAGV